MNLFDRLKRMLGQPPADPSSEAGTIARRWARPARTDGTVDGNRLKVLIIDDSPTVVATLARMLEHGNCQALEAYSAEDGLEIARSESPELIFLDIVLPQMDGFMALRKLRRDPVTQAIPIIMMSGNEQAAEQFYAERIGANDFMKKPFSQFEIFSRMDKLVEAGVLRRASHTDAAPL